MDNGLRDTDGMAPRDLAIVDQAAASASDTLNHLVADTLGHRKLRRDAGDAPCSLLCATGIEGHAAHLRAKPEMTFGLFVAALNRLAEFTEAIDEAIEDDEVPL